MPIPPLCDTPVPVACCTTWWEIAEELATIGGEAVQACLGEQCAEFPYFVSHDVPIGGGDYLAVWISNVGPRNFQTGKIFITPQIRYSYSVILSLEGHPMPTTRAGQMTPVPSPAEYNHASYFTYAAAQAMYRAVVNQLVASPASLVGPCTVSGLGQLVPQAPAHGSARWGLTVTIDGPIVW